MFAFRDKSIFVKALFLTSIFVNFVCPSRSSEVILLFATKRRSSNLLAEMSIDTKSSLVKSSSFSPDKPLRSTIAISSLSAALNFCSPVKVLKPSGHKKPRVFERSSEVSAVSPVRSSVFKVVPTGNVIS